MGEVDHSTSTLQSQLTRLHIKWAIHEATLLLAAVAKNKVASCMISSCAVACCWQQLLEGLIAGSIFASNNVDSCVAGFRKCHCGLTGRGSRVTGAVAEHGEVEKEEEEKEEEKEKEEEEEEEEGELESLVVVCPNLHSSGEGLQSSCVAATSEVSLP